MVCHATNCDLDNPGDPDVAGIGVVVSFGVTALLNLGVIIYLYFSGHLRGNRYRPVDLSLLNALGANPLKDTDDTSDAEKFEQKQLRIEMYERFIISMSDQQLVTGIAILVALYIKSCSVSVFSFEIAVSVAYFSCSIHISTLTVLRQYLKRYKKLAILRSIMMVILAIMLLAGLLMIESGTFYQVPSMKLGCALADFNSYISHNLTWVQVGNTAMICWFIISAYGCFLYELFDDRFIEVLGNWYFWLALSVGMSNDDKDKQCKKIFEFRETKIIERIGLPGVSKVRMVIIVIPYLLEEFSRSFLYKILWMLFYFTFGVATFCELWVQHGYYKQVLDVWGFGQLVPMFLLALPLLSAYEVYEEAAERRKPKDLHQTCSVATSGPTATMHGNDEIKPTVSVEATNHGCTGPQGPELPNHETRAMNVYLCAEAMPGRYKQAILWLIVFMTILSFLALQFYAILLGGIFNIARTSKPHYYLEKAALIVGYIFAGTHPLFHIFRGVILRVWDCHIYPPRWLLGERKGIATR